MFKFIKRNRLAAAFSAALDDGTITDQEFRDLFAQAEKDGLPQAELAKMFQDYVEHKTRPIRNRVIETRRMSPDDENEILEICRKLNVTPSFDMPMLMAKLLWRRDNEGRFDVPKLSDVPIILQKNEDACFVFPAQWAQVKTVKSYVGYAGLSGSVKIMKGLRFRIGNVGPIFSSTEELSARGDGKLIITTKRILFDGDHKTHSVNLGRIIDIDVREDGLRIAKDKGSDDFFLMSTIAAEFAAACLAELLEEP